MTILSKTFVMSKRKLSANPISAFFKRLRTENSEPSLPDPAPELPTAPTTPSKQRKSGFEPKWKESFSWLQESTDGRGMLCSLCIRHQRRPKKCIAGRATWVDVPCTTFRRQACATHQDSDAHKEAIVFEATAVASSGAIEAGFQREKDVNRDAMRKTMTLLYWLVKEELPHHTKFESLVDTIKDLGLDVLRMVSLGNNAKYTSNDFIHKTVVLFGDVIFRDIVEEIHQSPVYSIMIDETTDIAIHSQLSIYARYLHGGGSKTVFCALVKVRNGKADTIHDAVLEFLKESDLPVNKMCAFGSDGASVMLGRKNGVAAKLQTLVPHLLVNHCVAHRLALASSQAAEKVPYLVKWKAIVEQVFRFYHASGVRTASLEEIQTILNEPKVKITEAKDVRWLSHNKAVRAIRRCFQSLLTSLEHEAKERCDAVAQGLAVFMQQYRFVAALMMMSDVLPVLANLSLALQRKDAVYSTVGTLVMGAISTIRSMKDHPADHFRDLPQTVDALAEQPFRFASPTPHHVERFKVEVYDRFIDAVVSNLEKRFPHIPLLEAFSIFDPETVPDDQAERNGHCRDELQMLVERFRAVLPDAEQTGAEYTVLKNTVAGDEKLMSSSTTNIMEKVAGPLKEAMPNLQLLATVGLLVPSSTADCERGFSTLKRVKTAQRNRLCSKTLNAVLRVSMEGPSVQEFSATAAERMVTEWAKEKRRLQV